MCTTLNLHAAIRVAQRGATGGIGPDEIALHGIQGQPTANQDDAVVAVAGDNVARSRRGAADRAVLRIGQVHARVTVGQCRVAGGGC